jgi:hypothetical protein
MAVPLGAGPVTRREYLGHAGFVAGSTPLVGGLVYIERRDFVAQLGDSVMQGGWLRTAIVSLPAPANANNTRALMVRP